MISWMREWLQPAGNSKQPPLRWMRAPCCRPAAPAHLQAMAAVTPVASPSSTTSTCVRQGGSSRR